MTEIESAERLLATQRRFHEQIVEAVAAAQQLAEKMEDSQRNQDAIRQLRVVVAEIVADVQKQQVVEVQQQQDTPVPVTKSQQDTQQQ